MTTVFRCCNGSCRHMDDLRCTLDEINITNGGECKEYEYKEYEETEEDEP